MTSTNEPTAEACLTYKRLVQALAADQEVEFTELCSVIGMAGRTGSELACDVAAARRKREKTP